MLTAGYEVQWIQVLLFLLPIAVAFAAYYLMRRWAGRPVLCGRCGYPIAGLRRGQCPECGIHFARVNPVAPGIAFRWTFTMLLAAWTFGIILAPTIYWRSIEPLLPSIIGRVMGITLNGPQSGAYTGIAIRLTLQTRTGWLDTPEECIHMEWAADFYESETMIAQLVVHPTQQLATLTAGHDKWQHEGTLDANRLATWMMNVFPDADAQAIAREAEAIVQLVEDHRDPVASAYTYMTRVAPIDDVFCGRNRQSTAAAPRPVTSAVLLTDLCVLVLSSIGVVLMLLWARTRLRRLAAAATADAAEIPAAPKRDMRAPPTDPMW